MRSFIMVAFTAVGLALASTSAFAGPIAPLGKAADAIDARSNVYYYGYRYGYYHHRHRHCWWRHGYRVCRGWY
jgi:hypothetical protein